uniref:Inhibitor of apoptosis 2 n=1 Tax=Hemiscolopendra marginata TaxID=943146 RepID=A0A646QCJ6_9MYRI
MGDNRVLKICNSSMQRRMSEGKDYDEQNGLNHEETRLNTFRNWPANAPVAANKLAKAGFYYVGPNYRVQCFSCQETISEWDYGDQVLQKHGTLNPHCDFVNQKSNNVPFIPKTNVQTPRPLITNLSRTSVFSNTSTSNNSLLNGEVSRSTAEEKIWSSFAVLRNESERLKTFKGWPLPFVRVEDLAKAGFFYLKDGDKVQCFFCKGVVGEWERDDIPMSEHQRHFPNCLFVRGIDVGNVPIEENTNDQFHTPKSSPDDVTGRYQYEMENFSGPEKGHINALNLERCNLGGVGITKHRGPKHPNYATLEARLRSYESWLESIPQNPQELAMAGFYYAGVSDHVRCFHCDGGLRNWEATDNPWIEHARWFGNCSFVLLIKGNEFVTQAKLLHPPSLDMNSMNTEIPCVRKVTIEEINSLLDSPIVKTVLDCGVTLPVIRYALQKRIQYVGEPFVTPDALYEACLRAQEDLKQSSVQYQEGNCEMQPRSAVNLEQTFSNSRLVNSNMTTSVSSPNLPCSSFKDLTRKTQELFLAEENQRLKEMQLCKICMDEEVGIVFLPCGHLISCPNCAPSITDCPVCRKPITHTVRTYLS